MVDIFDEVEEDLRAERAERFLKKYAWVIAAVAVAIVGAAGGWQLWNRWQHRQDDTAAVRYIAVENATGRPNDSATGNIGILEELAATAPEGYKTLARMRAAELKADAGALSGAAALRNEVAADPQADHLLRELATLQATQRELDHGDPAQLQAALKPLADASNPWTPLAREQLAMLDLRQGRLDDARQKLRMLSIDIGAPSGLRARASALLAGLGSQNDQ